MKRIFLLAALAWTALVQAQTPKLADGLYVKFSTTKGDIICQLYYEKVPMTVGNFVGLAEGKLTVDTTKVTKPFFNGLKFHRVIADFMIQGGDPQGNGMGGPGYKFFDEIDTSLKHLSPGILSMANSGPNTNGSQFFITHKATPWLDGKHTVFGKVVQGQDVVNAIAQNDVMNTVTIIRVGKAAQAFNGQAAFDGKYLKLKEAEKAKQAVYAKIASMTDIEYNADFKKRVSAQDISEGLTQTASGLIYVIQKPGEAYKAEMGSKMSLHYKGTFFATGEKFDASYDRNVPMDFNYQVQRMIPGFEEGLKLIGKGGKAKLYIPYRLAYGAQGNPRIPAYADLVFEIEMVNLEAPQKTPVIEEHHDHDGHDHAHHEESKKEDFDKKCLQSDEALAYASSLVYQVNTVLSKNVQNVIDVEIGSQKTFFQLSIMVEIKDHPFGPHFDGKRNTIVVDKGMVNEISNKSYGNERIKAVIAHEFAHALQYKKEFMYLYKPGIYPELHADFLAGFYIGRNGLIEKNKLTAFSEEFYSIGDDLPFWDPMHHGTHSERRCAFLEGYKAAVQYDFNIAQAYSAGLDYIRLRYACDAFSIVRKYSKTEYSKSDYTVPTGSYIFSSESEDMVFCNLYRQPLGEASPGMDLNINNLYPGTYFVIPAKKLKSGRLRFYRPYSFNIISNHTGQLTIGEVGFFSVRSYSIKF